MTDTPRYTQDEIDELGRGKAFLKDDGTYAWPIADVSDLRDAVQAIGRATDAERIHVKRYIMKRAAELGPAAEAWIPEDWETPTHLGARDSEPAAWDAWEQGDAGWVCPKCEEEVVPENSQCPECGAVLDAGANQQDGSSSGGNPNAPGLTDGTGSVSSHEPYAVRASTGADGSIVLTGTAITYNNRTTIWDRHGAFGETISPGAARRSALAPGADVALLHGHDGESNPPLARTSSGTLRLFDSPTGMKYRATLDPTSPAAQSVASAVRRGDLRGMSFSFTVAPDGERWNQTMTERVIHEFKSVPEISVVWRPAYPTGTSATVEAETDGRARRREALRRRVDLIRRRMELETRCA